jgi:hypothetical protein
MAESTRQQARQRRTEARERRRRPAAQPFDEIEEDADGSEPEAGGQDGGEQRSTQRVSDIGQAVRRTAATAAVAAALGALAGAAKAVIDRRSASVGHGEEGSGEPHARGQADQSQEEPATEVASADEEAPTEEGTSGSEEAATEPDTQAREEAAPFETDESEGVGREAARGERDDPTGKGGEAESGEAGLREAPRPPGMAGSDAAEIVEQARKELERVLHQEAESVSSLERSDGHWAVTLEVVEVRRIPDSTDILSSYEVVLDDDRNVVRVTRMHRYRRSQVEER